MKAKEAEDKYRAIFDAVDEALIIHDGETGSILEVNRKMCEMFGCTEEEARRLNISALSGREPTYTQETLARLIAETADGQPQILEWQARDRSGRTFWTEVHLKPIVLDGQRHVMANIRDIDQRKQAEEAFRESQECFQQLADNVEAVFWMKPLDSDGVLYINSAYERIWGRSMQDLVENPESWAGTVHPEDLELLQKKDFPNTFGEHEFRIIRPDGEIRWINARTFPVRNEKGEVYRVAGISVDITDRKRIEEALRESAARYRIVTESSLAGVYLIQDGIFRYVNPVLAQAFGYTPEEIIHRLGPLDLIHPEDRPRIAVDIRRRLDGETDAAVNTFRGLRKDGSVIFCEVLTRPVEYQGQRAIMGTFLDVTDRRLAEEALKTSEANYRTIFESVNDAVMVIDLDTHEVLETNQRFLEMSGYTSEEVKQFNVADLCSHDPSFTVNETREWLRKATEEGPQLSEWLAEARNGRRFWVEVNLKRTSIGGHDRLLAVIRDISERKQAEEVRRQAYKELERRVEERTIWLKSANLQLQREIEGRRRTENMIRLQRDLAIALSGKVEMEEALRLCIEYAVDISGMDSGGVYLIDPASGSVELAVHTGLSPEFVQSVLRYQADSLNAHLVMAGEPVYARMQGLPGLLDNTGVKEGLRSAAIIPVLHNGQGIACINIASHKLEEVPATARAALETIAAQVGSAIARVKIQEDLRESEERFRAFMDHLPGVAFMMDPENRFVYLNQDLERILQKIPKVRVAGGFLGRRNEEIWPPEAAAKFNAENHQVMSTGESCQFIESFPQEDGLHSWLVHKFPILGREGSSMLVGGIGIEVTGLKQAEEALRQAKKELELRVAERTVQLKKANEALHLELQERQHVEESLRQSEAKYRSLVEQIPAVTYIISLEGGPKVLYISPQIKRILGFTPEEWASDPDIWKKRVHPEDFDRAWAALQRSLVAGEPLASEYRMLSRSGQVVWFRDEARMVYDHGGKPLFLQGLALDITGRKLVEEALQTSETNYRTIFNAVNDGIAVVDMTTGDFVDVNRKWCEMTGYTSEEARGLNVAALCLEDDPYSATEALRHVKQALRGGPQLFEWRARTKDGQPHWVEVNLKRTVIQGADRILTVVRDISERKRAEEAVWESEAKYRTLVEQIPAITFIAALDDVVTHLYISPQIEAVLGFTPDEWVADPELFKKQIHPEDRDRVLTGLILSYSQGGPFLSEYRLVSKSGQIVWIRDESRAVYDRDGRPLFMQGVALDITARKRAEEALQEANTRLRALVQASPLAIIAIDPLGRVTSWNPAAERIFGWRAAEVKGRPLVLVPPEKQGEFRAMLESVLQGKFHIGIELRRQKKDGSAIDVSLSTAPLFGAAGDITGAMGILEDITARKRTEEALRESEARYRAIFESAGIGIAQVDLERRAQEINPAFLEMLGFTREEALRLDVADVTHPDDFAADMDLFRELVAGKRNTYQIEKRYIRKDSRIVWARLSVSLVRDASGLPQFAICLVEDITERKRAEAAAEEIRRQQEAILSNIADLAWFKDREGRYIIVNEPLGKACGLKPQDLAGKSDLELWPQDLAQKYRLDDQEVMRTGQKKRVEEPLTDKAGNTMWVETIKSPIFNEKEEVIGTTGLARDITERRRMEEALRKVSRALKAITECHQAMLRASSESELLDEVSRIIVEVGGYPMAWVGFREEDARRTVRPVAQQGFDEGYLGRANITWADAPRGRGPVGTSIRTGKPAICRDTQIDPNFIPWREEAARRGYASVLGLPLKGAQTFGCLAIYAGKPNAFDDEEINLLLGLADDLAYGITTMRARAERRLAEEALRESEEKYRGLMNFASDAILLADSEGNLVEANRRAEELLGYPKEELLGMNYVQLHPRSQLDRVVPKFKEIVTKGFGQINDALVLRKDGRRVPVDITGSLIEFADKKVAQGIFRDITEHKKDEEALRDSEQKLRLLASQLLSVQERERRRVARELHDELGQALTVLKIHLVAIEEKLRQDQQELKAGCEQLLSYIDGVIENVRRLSWDLSPSILEDLGLSSSLGYLIDEICRKNNIQGSVAMDRIDHLFSPETQINIYRIFQESLTNIVKHANAGQISVIIKKQDGKVSFKVQDNGRGFDLEQALSRNVPQRSLGLTAMKERALMANGSLRIWSRSGKGTKITFTIPIDNWGK